MGKATDNVSFAIKTEFDDIDEGADAEAAGVQSQATIEEAYITLKEFGHQAVTMTFGLMEVEIGLRGDADVTTFSNDVLGVKTSLNFEPVLIDIYAATLNEGGNGTAANAQSDSALYGMNLDWWFGENNLVTGSILSGDRSHNDAPAAKPHYLITPEHPAGKRYKIPYVMYRVA